MIQEQELRAFSPSIIGSADFCNPTGQSYLLDTNVDKVMIVRPLGAEGEVQMSGDEEIMHRALAYRLHKEHLGRMQIVNEFVVADGFTAISEAEEKKEKLIIRIMDKYTNVVPLTDVRREDILQNEQMAADLSSMFWGYAKMSFLGKAVPERGANGQFGQGLPWKFESLFNHFTAENMFVGNDKNGNQKVFCDADWLLVFPDENNATAKELRFKSTIRFAAATVFFKGVEMFNKSKSILKLKENDFASVQSRRGSKKESV